MPAEYLCHCLLCIEQILIYIADRSVDVDLIPAVCLSECCHSLSGTDRLDNLAVLRRSLADICARRCLNREGLCKCTYAILCIYRRAVRRSRRGCCRAVCVRCGLPTELLLDRLLTLLIWSSELRPPQIRTALIHIRAPHSRLHRPHTSSGSRRPLRSDHPVRSC